MKAPPPVSILDAIQDDHLFRNSFRGELNTNWNAWIAFLAALFALPMTDEQRKIFRECTGRSDPSRDGHKEAWLVIGRRGGKSFVISAIAVYLACFRNWTSFLGPGERATVMVIAADRKQARVILRYCKGLIQSVPMLARLIEGETRESLDLRNRVTLETHTASFRTVRGYSICAALLDELAFFSVDEASADPDFEIINAIRPAMATIPGSMLLCASSPYARKGALWNAYRKYHGKDHPILVWQAPTRVMNPSVPQTLIDEALEADASSAKAEYFAEFRSDIESFISREAVEACVSTGIYERAPEFGVTYTAFVDPSGGSADAFTLAIGHKADDTIVIDAIRAVKPPFSPEAVVYEFSHLLKAYNCTKVVGDRYAGIWPVEQFLKCQIQYEQSAKAKSDLYTAFLPVLNSRQVALLDDKALIQEICGLERRTARGGRDSIDHAPNAHDDRANALAGLCAQFTLSTSTYDDSLAWVGGPGEEEVPFCKPRSAWGAIQFI